MQVEGGQPTPIYTKFDANDIPVPVYRDPDWRYDQLRHATEAEISRSPMGSRLFHRPSFEQLVKSCQK